MAAKQTTKNKVVKEQKLLSIAKNLESLPILGMIFSWRPGGDAVKHADVIQALKDVGLDEKVAREIAPAQAFTRAANRLKVEGVIDVLRSETDTTTFQFTDKLLDSKKGEWKYSKKCLLSLNKITGKVSCPDSRDLEQKAQTEVDRCTEDRTSSDITAIVHKLFDTSAEIFPIGGGAHLVLKDHLPYAGKVVEFLTRLKGKCNRFPILAGTVEGNETVKTTIADKIDGTLTKLLDAVESFGRDTRQATLQSKAVEIKETKLKIEAYSVYLQDKSKELIAQLEKVDDRLRERVEELNKERLDPNATREDVGDRTRPGICSAILAVLKEASEKKPITKAEILEKMKVLFPDRDPEKLIKTINGQVLYNLPKVAKIPVGRKGDGFWVEKNAQASKE